MNGLKTSSKSRGDVASGSGVLVALGLQLLALLDRVVDQREHLRVVLELALQARELVHPLLDDVHLVHRRRVGGAARAAAADAAGGADLEGRDVLPEDLSTVGLELDRGGAGAEQQSCREGQQVQFEVLHLGLGCVPVGPGPRPPRGIPPSSRPAWGL